MTQILGVWMWPQSVRLHGAQQIAQRCARMGVTDIFFLAKGLSGTAAYTSAVVPMDTGRDLLGELLPAAHALGIRVHAWLTSASDERYLQTHPESARMHYTRGPGKGLVALTDEGYIGYMAQAVQELCSRYAIDGLHLDYIRYNHLLYGWSESDRARYAAEGACPERLRALMDGTFPAQDGGGSLIFDAYRDGDASAQALARVRRQDVVHFARTLTQAARAQGRSLTLSAALMPEGTYADTAFADLHYGQRYDDAVALYDLVLPMAYSHAYGKDSAWVRGVAQGALQRGAATVMGLHAYEGGTAASLRADAAALDGLPIRGICLFREGAFIAAIPDGHALTLINTTGTAADRLTASCGAESLDLNISLAPGEEQRLVLPFAAESVRAFFGETELCVYMTQGAG